VTKHGNFEEKIPSISILKKYFAKWPKFVSKKKNAADNPKKENENHNYSSHPVTCWIHLGNIHKRRFHNRPLVKPPLKCPSHVRVHNHNSNH